MILCCPDKFRGSLTAAEAAAAMAAAWPDAIELPLADGGEGTLEVLGGRRMTTRVTGPLDDPVDAEWGLLEDGTAVIEMARASGLALVSQNDPLHAHTRGTGELLLAAAAHGVTRAIVAVGGSASTDGGVGALEVLGYTLPFPITVACDVTTRFVDAARIFGPQKGASPGDVEVLEARLRALDFSNLPGSGAAGGLAGGLAAHGATLRSGFDVVAEAVDLDAHLQRADLVITGEGRLDASSLNGKVVGGVLRRARGATAVIAGRIDIDPGTRVISLTDLAGSPERAMRDAAALVREASSRIMEGSFHSNSG